MLKKIRLQQNRVKEGAGRFARKRLKKGGIDSVQATPLPKITNETIDQHREEVLSGARKYIYPLRHSRHKVIIITISLLSVGLISFMTFVLLGLYRFQSTSTFIYQVTKVLPLPVARVGGVFVSYESYLFELRHYIHYFENQQEVDFTSEQGKAQLDEQRKKSLQRVVDFAYVKKIARDQQIEVSGAEIDQEIELLRVQNKLGNDDRVFNDILKDFWGWSVADFRRSIEQELLTNKVLSALDTETHNRAQTALDEIRAGKSFAEVAKQYSDDPATKDKGGEMGYLISQTDRNIPLQTIDTLFKLKANEVSEVVDIGYGLEILKNLGFEGNKAKAARIFFDFKDLDTYLNDYKAKQKANIFIKV